MVYHGNSAMNPFLNLLNRDDLFVLGSLEYK